MGNCLVVGEPGGGKSGVLHDAVSAMLRLGWDVVFLAADLVGAESPGQLRQELGTDLDLSAGCWNDGMDRSQGYRAWTIAGKDG